MQSSRDREDLTTVCIVFSAISESTNGLGIGRGLHAHVIKRGMDINVTLGNALLSMYANLNCVESAKRIFNEINSTDVISWNTLILVIGNCKLIGQLKDVFQWMERSSIKPNSFTMVALLAACKDETCLNIGKSIHGYVFRHGLEFNLALCTALTDMYMKCGNEATARHLFESLPDRDLISWNALITCYIENNRHNEALLIFQRMLAEVDPNSVTVINIISSCAHLANLPLSRSVHAYAVRREFAVDSHIYMGNALVTMYARCGSIHSAEKVFRCLLKRDVISWNVIIAAYGMHGYGKEALTAFSEMKRDGFIPTSVTFVSVLSACN
ncbi:hypothetical protein IFM89_004719 [Coptis chinensis]|uniref:Pentatricopeptide repeat-containing protein n=1 Tax=Coptis chinensis TaxID=261450 RepID=A0A835GXK5_9MAGN|nr:hypothetical protein IFM89_004719 [Coptis chinensis]